MQPSNIILAFIPPLYVHFIITYLKHQREQQQQHHPQIQVEQQLLSPPTNQKKIEQLPAETIQLLHNLQLRVDMLEKSQRIQRLKDEAIVSYLDIIPPNIKPQQPVIVPPATPIHRTSSIKTNNNTTTYWYTPIIQGIKSPWNNNQQNKS
jgi:hypothetical protein